MSERPRITLIVAMGPNGEIGIEGRLPWHLPGDLAHFKRTTVGHPIIMGRKTFTSIGRPLPRRRNLVLTRSPDRLPEGVEGASDPEDALTRCAGESEVFIIGGADIYRAFLPRADRLVLTEVQGEFAADTFFPSFDRSEWREVSRETHDATERDRHPHAFVVLERVGD